jgi:hypothetical protein
MTSGLFGRRFGTIAAVAVLACTVVLATQSASVLGADPPGTFLGEFGPDGTSTSDFELVGPVAVDQATGDVYVGDSAKDVIYKFDETGQPVDFGGAGIVGNELSGVPIPDPPLTQMAFDPISQVLYLVSENSVRAFEANGEPHEFTGGPGAGTSEIPGAADLQGVAVDMSGNIYAADRGDGKIRIYSADGALLKDFAPGISSPEDLAVTPTGKVIVVDGSGGKARVLIPSAFPVTGSTTYSLKPELLDDNVTYSVGVDPITGYIYLTQLREGIHYRVAAFEENGDYLGSFGDEGQAGELLGSPEGIAIGSRIYLSVFTQATDPDQSKVRMYEPFVFIVEAPTVEKVAASNLTSTSVTLSARINPNTLDTTYWFEYGLEDCVLAAPGVCTVLPVGGEAIGHGHEPVAVFQNLTGLNPNTKYFYRVVAENSEGKTESPSRSFTTQSSGLDTQLSDHRVWEQVSPVQKAGGTITNVFLTQAASDGSGIMFSSRGAILADPEGNRSFELAAVLARRTAAGQWLSEDLVAPHTRATQLNGGPEYKIFSPNLGSGILEPRDETPLSDESSELTPYLRINSSPRVFRPLVTSKEGFSNVAPGTEFGGEPTGSKNAVSLSGTNGDLTDIVLKSITPLLPGAEAGALYHWEDGNLSLVSELPVDEPGSVDRPVVGSGGVSVRHAVSEGGTRIFWATGEGLVASLNFTALYLRDTVAEESVRIDLPEPGADEAGESHPVFMSASADGSVVFFTDSQHLTADANPDGRDLYRCEVGDVGGSLGCVDLTDLSAGTPGDESADAEEVAAGSSDDGSILYFVASGVLDSEPNEFGDSAETESPNLYRWEEGNGLHYIATLSTKDGPDWGKPGSTNVGFAAGSSAYSSPSGRYLTFMSQMNLAEDESADPATGEPTQEVFLYDAFADELRCVSCDPNGASGSAPRMNGPDEGGPLFVDRQSLWDNRLVGAMLPPKTESEATSGYNFYQPRAVLDNGRVFYNSAASLVTGDSNGTWDVYQYEPLGVGTCGPASGSASIARSGNGCISLISSGSDSGVSLFLDASETGDDLFFATFAKLSATDVDNDVDVYDAKVNGVEAVLEPSSECEGEACRTNPPAPTEGAPTSALFNGAGNVKSKPAKHCRKGQKKVKRKGKVKCVKKKHHSGKPHKSRGAGK